MYSKSITVQPSNSFRAETRATQKVWGEGDRVDYHGLKFKGGYINLETMKSKITVITLLRYFLVC